MYKNRNTPAGTWWNSWSHRPAELVFLPDGVAMTPVLYSSKLRKTTLLTTPELVFGQHDPDGRRIAFETDHGGTRMAFRYVKDDPFTVRGDWNLLQRDEWALRHWVTLCLSAAEGEEVHFSAATGAAQVTVGDRTTTLLTGIAPVQVTGHESLEALVEDYEANGYFHRGSRATSARVLALRFNLEMMPALSFALAVADSADLSLEHARALLASAGPPGDPPLHEGLFAGALDAVRDVIGWNTLFDQVNGRRYTAISRIWNLGDFAVWFNDQTFAALMAGLFDGELARENYNVALASATPEGNFSCLVTSHDAWVDRTQAPHGSFILWSMYLRSGDRALLAAAYPLLLRNHRWWRANRDPDGRGLVSCGTSDVGEALYKGTAFGARNETGMDNSATHDEAVYDPVTRTLSTLDLGLNCALALDAEMLAAIAAELGHSDESAEFSRLAEETRSLIRTEFWDATRGIFANRQRDGGFVKSVGPTSFYPLLCGAADATQAARLLGHLADPAKFGGPYPLPNASRDDPAYADNVYWRGRIWGNVNFFVWQGLNRYGFAREARDLAAKGFAMFEQSWKERRLCGENYNGDTGEITDQGDADIFYTWGALLPLLAVSEIMDIGPWDGWRMTNDGVDVSLGPQLAPGGAVTVRIAAGLLTASRADGILWQSDFRGSLTHITLERGLFSVRLKEDCTGPASLCLGPGMSARLVAARVNGAEAATSLRNGMAELVLTGYAAGSRIDFHLRSPG